MSATTLEAYALSKGITTSYTEMDNAQKVGLAMEMFLEKTTYAAGNYARENETLAGSLGTAKSALENFLAGAGDIDAVITSFENAGKIIAENMAVVLPRLLDGIPKIVEALPGIVAEILPVLMDAGEKMVDGIMQGMANRFPEVAPLISQLVESFEEIRQKVIDSNILQEIIELLDNIKNAALKLAPVLVDIASDQVIQAIEVMSKALELLNGLIGGLNEQTDKLDSGQWKSFGDAIKSSMDIAKGPIATIGITIEGLQQSFQSTIDFIKNVFSGNWQEAWDDAWKATEGFVNAFIPQISLIAPAFGDVWSRIQSIFTNNINNLISQANDFIAGINRIFSANIPPLKLMVDTAGIELAGKATDRLAQKQEKAYDDLDRMRLKSAQNQVRDAETIISSTNNMTAAVDNYAEAQKGGGGAAKDAAKESEKAAKEAANEMLKIQNEFGGALIEALKRQKQEETDINKQAIQDQIDSLSDLSYEEIQVATNIKDTKIKLIDEETRARIAGISAGLDEFMAASDEEIQRRIDIIAMTDKETAAKLQAIKNESDAIKASSETEKQAIQAKQEQERRARLEKAVSEAKTPEELAAAQKALIEYEDDLKYKQREKERSNRLAELEQQRKDTLAAATKRIEDETALVVELTKKQTDEIAKIKKEKAAELTGLDEQQKEFEKNAEQMALSLMKSGEEGQQQALAIVEQFYPEWQLKGKTFVEKMAEGIDDNADLVNNAVGKLFVDAGDVAIENVSSSADIINTIFSDFTENNVKSAQKSFADISKLASTMLPTSEESGKSTDQILKDQTEVYATNYETIKETVLSKLTEMFNKAMDILRKMMSNMDTFLRTEGFEVGRRFMKSLGDSLIAEQANLMATAMGVADAIVEIFRSRQISEPGGDDSGFATGLSYVPEEGLYHLHKGEEVLTAAEARQNRFGETNNPAQEIIINQYFYGVREEQTAFEAYLATRKAAEVVFE